MYKRPLDMELDPVVLSGLAELNPTLGPSLVGWSVEAWGLKA